MSGSEDSRPPEPGSSPKRGFLDYIFQQRISVFDQLRPQRWNWYYLSQSLEDSFHRQAKGSLTGSQPANLRYFLLDGVMAASSEAFFLAYIPLFAVAYGATNQEIGWITAMGNLAGALALFPGARLLESTGQRKAIVLWSGGGLARLMLLLLALLPLLSLPAGVAVIAITSFNALRAFAANFSNPAWTSMVADIVPDRMRGRYFSNRNFAMGVASLVLASLAGWLVATGNRWSGNHLLGFQVVSFLAFATGMASAFFFSRIHDPPLPPAPAGAKTAGDLKAAFAASPGFLGFVICGFVWNMALQVAAPFFNVYLVKNLGATATDVGLATSASALTSLVGQVVFGRLMDRKGASWLLLVTGFPIAILPTLWAFYNAPWQVMINNLFAGFFWAGFNLASFNLLLMLTPAAQRPRSVALYQTVVFTAAVAGPLLGGWIADTFDFRLIFFISGGGRFVGMLIFLVMSSRVVKHHRQNG